MTGTVRHILNIMIIAEVNSGSEVISMNVICTINDKKKKKTYKLEELTPKQREEYGRKINESGMAAMGYVKKQ